MAQAIPSTRREVVDLLKNQGGMTAKQLASRLNVTAVAVRRHLSELEQAGLARASLMRQRTGRPTFVYSLTDAARDLLPTRYDTLALQILDAAHRTKGNSGPEDLFAARMEQLFEQYKGRMEGKTLAERVAELARIQEEAGYMASWEITEGGYILRERNCPIYHVACRFQHACRFELELFRRLLGADITRFRHQVNGEESCAYLIREKESPGAVRRRTGGKIPRRSHPSRIADQSIEHDPRA